MVDGDDPFKTQDATRDPPAARCGQAGRERSPRGAADDDADARPGARARGGT